MLLPTGTEAAHAAETLNNFIFGSSDDGDLSATHIDLKLAKRIEAIWISWCLVSGIYTANRSEIKEAMRIRRETQRLEALRQEGIRKQKKEEEEDDAFWKIR